MNRPPSIDHRRFEDPADDRGACRLASDACSRGAEHRLENCAPRDQGTLETALQYTALGLRVFPLRPRTKQPLPGLMWKQAATTDPQTIRAAWEANPGANVGVVCGEGVFVLDADSPRAEAALAGLGVPRTIAVRTGRGLHIYLRGAVRGAKLRPGLEVKGMGGYVVGAGSVHESGHRYRWEVAPQEAPIAAAPAELVALIGERSRRSGRPRARIGTAIPEGERNATLTRFAGRLRWSGASQNEIEGALLCANTDRCKPPLHAKETRDIAASIARYREGPPWIADPIGFSAGLDPSERSVLLSLCRHAKDDGGCRPGIRRLAEQSGLHRSSIPAVINRLEALGRIAVTRSRAGNSYRVLDSPIPLKVGSSVRARRTEGPSEAALGSAR